MQCNWCGKEGALRKAVAPSAPDVIIIVGEEVSEQFCEYCRKFIEGVVACEHAPASTTASGGGE